jgi:two-component system sensor histidine kinase DesK
MKLLDIPANAEKPSWAGLFGAVPALYIFWEPYQKGAAWPEWFLTSLAFAVFAVLAVLGSIYWSHTRVMQGVCAGMASLAIAFSSYRPSGVIFYIFVAAFGPLAVNGNLLRSAFISATAAVLIVVHWKFLWPPSWMPYVIASEALLVGAAITAVARQQTALRRTLKTAERERIARDLHDILGHTLSVIIVKSELAARIIDNDPGAAKSQIEDVERISRDALREVREAIAGYHQGNLRAELERARSTLETAGLRVEEHCDAIEMPNAYERVLALILREAVTNILRHARAQRCAISLHQRGETYVLEVRDNGAGGTLEPGMGMRGIRERVAALGGTVSWRSDQGTHLTIEVPLSTRTEGEAA